MLIKRSYKSAKNLICEYPVGLVGQVLEIFAIDKISMGYTRFKLGISAGGNKQKVIKTCLLVR